MGRAGRIAWGFLVGATLSEGGALAFVFRHNGVWLAAALRYGAIPAGTPLAWGLSVLVATAYVAYATLRSPVIRRSALRPLSWRPFVGARLVAIVMAVVTGFFEEVMFRKAGTDLAMRSGFGTVLQILFSAIAFRLVHAIWGLFAGQLRAAVSAMLATGVLGACSRLSTSSATAALRRALPYTSASAQSWSHG
jgi:hypothetical protein